MDFFCGECRARSAYTYVQSDLALHSPLFHHYIPTKRMFSEVYGISLFNFCQRHTAQYRKTSLNLLCNYRYSTLSLEKGLKQALFLCFGCLQCPCCCCFRFQTSTHFWSLSITYTVYTGSDYSGYKR